MEFIHFEALDEDENGDFNTENKVSDDLSSFISKGNKNVYDYYTFDNVTRFTKNALKNAFIEFLNVMLSIFVKIQTTNCLKMTNLKNWMKTLIRLMNL